MVNDSRVKSGSLKIGPTATAKDFSCQPTAISIVPTVNQAGDPVEVLCGDTLAAASTTTWALVFTAIQDFDDPEGLLTYAFDNDGTEQDFEWKPSATSPTFSGKVTVQALTIGGDVAVRITTDATWPITGKPVKTPVTPPLAPLAAKTS